MLIIFLIRDFAPKLTHYKINVLFIEIVTFSSRGVARILCDITDCLMIFQKGLTNFIIQPYGPGIIHCFFIVLFCSHVYSIFSCR